MYTILNNLGGFLRVPARDAQVLDTNTNPCWRYSRHGSSVETCLYCQQVGLLEWNNFRSSKC